MIRVGSNWGKIPLIPLEADNCTVLRSVGLNGGKGGWDGGIGGGGSSGGWDGGIGGDGGIEGDGNDINVCTANNQSSVFIKEGQQVDHDQIFLTSDNILNGVQYEAYGEGMTTL